MVYHGFIMVFPMFFPPFPVTGPPSAGGALASWLLHSAAQLHRCPAPDPATLRRRGAEGEGLGLAQRFARRFTCSKVTVPRWERWGVG